MKEEILIQVYLYDLVGFEKNGMKFSTRSKGVIINFDFKRSRFCTVMI